MEDFSFVIRKYTTTYKRTKKNDCKKVYELGLGLYQAMFQQYDICEDSNNTKQQIRICDIIDIHILKKMKESASITKDERLQINLLALHKRFFALSSRRILRNFALYIESGKRKKVWVKTLDTVRPIFAFADDFMNSDNLDLMRVSCMPGLGKSYIGNLVVANAFGNDSDIQILRVTYSDDLVRESTKLTKRIMMSKEYAEVFPRFKDTDVFRYSTMESFCLIDSDNESSFFAVTRDGQSTGKRAQLVVIDDLLKGEVECNNATLMRKLVNRYDSDWSSRADDDSQKTLLLGTMWSDKDLLNVMLERAEQHDELIESKQHKYTLMAKDGSSVFIGIPALDDNDESTCPLRFSTKKLIRLREVMEKFMWQAVYQQDPIAPEGIEFDYKVLRQYSAIPQGEITSRHATLDPARRGKNFVAMPICYKIDGVYHLVDFLYQKKAMSDLYDDIVDRIIRHGLHCLHIENNTDTSLKALLDKMLKDRGYSGCTISEVFSVQVKEQRIKDNQGRIRNEIVFPEKAMYGVNTEIGKAMDGVTNYSFVYPNKFDDGIDSLALFSAKFIDNTKTFNRIEKISRQAVGMI